MTRVSTKADALAAIELRGPSTLAEVNELLPDVNGATLNGWLMSFVRGGKLERVRQRKPGGPFTYGIPTQTETEIVTVPEPGPQPPEPQPTDPFAALVNLQRAVRQINDALADLGDTVTAAVVDGRVKITMEIS